MFDKLKKLLEGGIAQANIFDGGKTYQSVVNNRTPQQQNAVQQQQLQARQFNPARPQQAPQQNFTDKLRDILDANSQADKFRRAQEGQALDYRKQQEQARQQAAQQARVVRPQVQTSGLDNVNKFSSSFNERYIGGLGRGLIRGAEWLTPGDQTGTANNMVNTFFPEAGTQAAQGGLARLADKNSIGGKLGTGAKAATEVVMTAIPSGAATKATQGLGAINKLSQGGRVAKFASRAIPEMVGGVPASAVSVFNARGRGDEQNLTKEVGIGLAIDAATPTVFEGIGKLARPVIDAAGNAIGKLAPRSVAEITQEVTTARQPAIANNAPRTRVTPDGTILPPRPASEIAAELAASKARAADPNVQAKMASIKAAGQPSTPVKKINMTPDDQRILADFNDIANGFFKPDAKLQRKIEYDATQIAEKYNIPLRSTPQEMAEEFDNVLQRGVTKPEFAPKPDKRVPQDVPRAKQDPLEALKAEARKYKSAEEFTQHLGRQKAAGDPATTALLSDMSSKAQKLIDGGMSSKAAANRVFNDTFDTLRLQPENYKTLDEFINAQGKPFYHGTDANFDRYSLGNFGKTDQGFTGKGIYLSGRKGNARQYGKNVVESYANLKNPLEYTDSYIFGAFSPDGLRARLGLPPKASAEEVTAALKSRGHDGVVIHEDTGTGIRKNEEVVVLDPTQVRTKQQLTDLYNQATKPKAYYQNVPKSNDPLEALKAEARKYKSADEFVNSQVSRPKTTDNVWQDTLPSGTRPDSIKEIAKSGGNPLYHDTTADGVLGILDSGEIKASQAPFSSLAGQGRRVSTTRNFDNYSRYNKSPYRLVIDESKTGQRAIPDNREEFESIFRKGVSTKAVNSIAIDTTNPALLSDIRSGKLKSVIESAKKKGIAIEPFEGKVLPNEGANAEVQTMTSRAFSKAFPEYKTRISQLIDLYNQAVDSKATKPPKAYYQNVPKSYTEPKTAFEQNTGVVAPTRAKATIQEPVVKSGAVEQPKALGEGMPPAKAGASPAAPVPPRKPGKKGKTNTALNTNRMDLTPEQRAQLDPKVQAVVDTMSNEDVVRVAKGAGLDTNTYSPGETRVKIAEQLNARQDVVRIMNEAEVARKAGDTERAAELLKQAAEQGRTVRSQGTDLGRQLQARKIIANELDTPQQRVFKLLDEAGVNPDVYAKRFAGVDFTDFKQVVDAYRELVPAKAGQWLDTVRYNSMLSSPLTQMVNIFGNAQGVLGVAPIEKTIKGGIDSIAGLFGKERQYAAGEGAAYLKGEAKAVGKAAKAFMNALRGVDDYANQDFTDYNIPLATQGAGGKVYNALSFPMRVLDGMDKFFRTLAAAGEDAALTKRTSKGIALKGDRQSLLEQEAAYRVFQADSHIPGQGAALNAMDSIADLVMSGRNNKNPIVRTLAKFTIPFVKTINNINKQGNFEYSPLGFLNLIGKEDKVEGITRAVMGTAVFGTSALMLKGGDMTWAEPRNAEERARFRAEGKQPYAVKIGGKWVGFSKLHPAVSFPMAMTAALDDAFNKGEIDQSFIDKTLTGFAKYGNFMSDQSYAKSVGDTLGAIGGDKEAIARAVSNQWQQLIPARALTGWIARMSDDVERKVDTTAGYFDQQVQAFMQQYPGLRQKTPTRDYRGEPIAANNPVLNAFSPVRVTNDRGVNPLDAEQDAIKAATEQPELLNKRQLKEIDDRTADKVREAQKQLISQPGWSDLTPEEKKSGLSRLESDIKAVEKLQYQAEKQVGQYSGSFTGKSTKLTANQKALINDGVKIGKYVGKSDSTEAKTNKEKYEQALEKFNDPDNGYSKVEKVKKTEELKRLTVQKDYDEDTTMLHGMSKEDVWGFLSTYEDGKAMADKLLALDDTLTAAGVQDKNKFRDKYGNITIKPKEKGSKGGSKAKTVKGQAEAVSSERKLRALLANTNNKTSYRKPATQSAKIGLKKFAVKSAGITSRKGA